MRNPTFVAALLALALAAPLASAQTGVATVNFNDQESDGTTVLVESASLSDGGFVVIHDDTLADDAVGSVVGVSGYLGPGFHDDIEINITGTFSGDVELTAMAHFDSNGNETYDFESSEGQDDGPYTDSGAAVTETATVSMGGGDGNETDDDDDGRGAPTLGIVLVGGVLAALAIASRRR